MNDSPKETGRLEAFSDGVFAIAMTLLVLNLAVPTVAQLHPVEGSQHSLQSYLLSTNQLRVYAAYLISFLTVLVMWASHHTMFTIIRRTDQRFLLLNGVLLLFITLVPFPTGLVANFFGPTPDGQAAIMVYGGTFFSIALLFNLVARYAFGGNRLVDPDAAVTSFARRTLLFIAGPIVYVVAMALALVNVYVSGALLVGMLCFYAAPLLLASTRQPTS